jgi:hypothetical protein
MRTSSITLLSMGSAAAASAALAASVFAVLGAGKVGTIAALQTTARFSFLLFWLAYASGGLVVLFGSIFQPLARRGREFGLAFASAQLVHVSLVAWLCWIGATPGIDVFIFFLPPLAVVYVLALFSIPALQKALGRMLWRVLRTVGMTYIAYAFAADFVNAPPQHIDARYLVAYLPFAILTVAAPVLHAISLVPSFRRAPATYVEKPTSTPPTKSGGN